EALSPAAAPDHWDIIEGQGSLIHPGYAAVTLGLLHGSQADDIVLCHDPRREFNLDSPQVKIPPLGEVIDLYLAMGRLTNADIRCSGISLNTKGMSESERERALEQTRAETGALVFDPVATGVGELVDALALPC
ncbi:MAG: NAD-dependent epimerase/dehydratase family protein, partial [Halieaceae bacterium]|nr:NAD-dependent epimerase/dehydratase family protein [Halieaceae bacterium]